MKNTIFFCSYVTSNWKEQVNPWEAFSFSMYVWLLDDDLTLIVLDTIYLK